MTTTDGRSKLRKGGREMVIPTQALILRFRIELHETEPLVWRAIEVSGDATFWDLHVAIQDAMGWLDYHLHRFTVPHPRTKKPLTFGIHNLHQDCDDPPSWAMQIASVFTWRNPEARYAYDFGDDWRRTVRLVDVLKRDFKARYPRCVGGARACPPEDCCSTTPTAAGPRCGCGRRAHQAPERYNRSCERLTVRPRRCWWWTSRRGSCPPSRTARQPSRMPVASLWPRRS